MPQSDRIPKPLRGKAFLRFLKLAARIANSWPRWMKGERQ
jgi:hypothetical protein